MSDKEFKQNMAAIGLSNAENLMNKADEIGENIKPQIKKMQEYYTLAMQLIKAAGSLLDETH